MALRILLVLSLALSCSTLSAQERFENKQYGFSMDAPEGWITAGQSDIIENLEQYEMSEEELAKLLEDHQGNIPLISYYKYDPQTVAGLIPTIQINLRLNPYKKFAQFQQAMVASTDQFKAFFEDFAFAVEPTTRPVSGIESVYFVGTFSMKAATGDVIYPRSRTYAVPNGRYFIQLNFTDGTKGEDESQLFDQLVESIRIEKR